MKRFAMSLTLIPKDGKKFHVDEIYEAMSKEALEAERREFCATFGYKIVQMIIREVW